MDASGSLAMGEWEGAGGAAAVAAADAVAASAGVSGAGRAWAEPPLSVTRAAGSCRRERRGWVGARSLVDAAAGKARAASSAKMAKQVTNFVLAAESSVWISVAGRSAGVRSWRH